MTKQRTCRVCGCSEFRACRDLKKGAGLGCHWVAKDLCNVCDDKASAIKLNASQRDSLVALHRRRATARDRSVYVEGGMRHPEALRRRGLIGSEYVQTRRRTFYWVTLLGHELVRRWRGKK